MAPYQDPYEQDDESLEDADPYAGMHPVEAELAALPDLHRDPAQVIAEMDAYDVPLHKIKKSGVFKTFGKGLVSGLSGLGEAVGSVGQGFTDSDFMGDVEQYWSGVSETMAPDEDLRNKRVFENPEIALDPRWWAHGLGQLAPALAITSTGVGAGAAVGGGLAGAAAGTGARAGAKAGMKAILSPKGLQMAMAQTGSPEKLVAAAKLGARIGGGIVGGSVEGVHSAAEVFERGGSRTEAGVTFAGMTAFSGIGNAISLGAILEPYKFKELAFKSLTKRGMDKVAAGRASTAAAVAFAGVNEGFQEYLEKPAEAAIMTLADKVIDTESRFIAEGYGPLIADSFKQVDDFLLGMVPGMGGASVSFHKQVKQDRESLHVQKEGDKAPVEGEDAKADIPERTIQERQANPFPVLNELEAKFEEGVMDDSNVEDDQARVDIIKSRVGKRLPFEMEVVPDNKLRGYLKAANKVLTGDSTKVVFAKFEKGGERSKYQGFSTGDTVVVNVLARDPMKAVLDHELKHRIDNAMGSEAHATEGSFSRFIADYVGRVASGEVNGVSSEAWRAYSKEFEHTKRTDENAQQKIDYELSADGLAAVMNDPQFWAEVQNEAPETLTAFETEALKSLENLSSKENKPVFDGIMSMGTDGAEALTRSLRMARAMRDSGIRAKAAAGDFTDEDLAEMGELSNFAKIIRDRGVISMAEEVNLIPVTGLRQTSHQVFQEVGTLGESQKSLLGAYEAQQAAERPGIRGNLDALEQAVGGYLMDRHSSMGSNMTSHEWKKTVRKMVKRMRKLDHYNYGDGPELRENDGRQILEVVAEKLLLGADATPGYFDVLKSDKNVPIDIQFSIEGGSDFDQRIQDAIRDGVYPDGARTGEVPKLVGEVVSSYTSKVDAVRRKLDMTNANNQDVVAALYALSRYMETNPNFDGTNAHEIIQQALSGSKRGDRTVGGLIGFGERSREMAVDLFSKTDVEQAADAAIKNRNENRSKKRVGPAPKVRQGVEQGILNRMPIHDPIFNASVDSKVNPVYKKEADTYAKVKTSILNSFSDPLPNSPATRELVSDALAKHIEDSVRSYGKTVGRTAEFVSARYLFSRVGNAIGDSKMQTLFRTGERGKKNSSSRNETRRRRIIKSMLPPGKMDKREEAMHNRRSEMAIDMMSVDSRIADAGRQIIDAAQFPDEEFDYPHTTADGESVPFKGTGREYIDMMRKELDPLLTKLQTGELGANESVGDAESMTQVKKLMKFLNKKGVEVGTRGMKPITTDDYVRLGRAAGKILYEDNPPMVRALQTMEYARWWRNNKSEWNELARKYDGAKHVIDDSAAPVKVDAEAREIVARFDAMKAEQDKLLPKYSKDVEMASGDVKSERGIVTHEEIMSAYQVFFEAGEKGESYGDSIQILVDHLRNSDEDGAINWGTRKRYFMSDGDMKRNLLDQLAEVTGLAFSEEKGGSKKAPEAQTTRHTKTREKEDSTPMLGNPIHNILDYSRTLETQLANFEVVDALAQRIKTASDMDVLTPRQLNAVTKNVAMLYGKNPYEVSPVMAGLLKFNNAFWTMYPLSLARISWYSGRNVANQGTMWGGMIKEFSAGDVIKSYNTVFAPVFKHRVMGRKDQAAADIPRALLMARDRFGDDLIEKVAMALEYGLNRDVIPESAHSEVVTQAFYRRLQRLSNTLMVASDDFNRLITYTTAFQIGENLIKEVHGGALTEAEMFKRLKVDNMTSGEHTELAVEWGKAHDRYLEVGDMASYDGYLNELALLKNEKVNFNYQTAGRSTIEQDPNSRPLTGIMTFQRGTAEQLWLNGIQPIIDAIDVKKRGGELDTERLQEGLRGVGMYAASHWFSGLVMAALIGEKTTFDGDEEEYRASIGWMNSLSYSPISPGASVAGDMMASMSAVFGAVLNGDEDQMDKYTGKFVNRAMWFLPLMDDFRNIAEATGNVKGIKNLEILEAAFTEATLEDLGDPVERSFLSWIHHVGFGTDELGGRTPAELMFDSAQVPFGIGEGEEEE